MGKDTRISWAHHTQNFWIGCTKVSPGCANCYAEAQQDHLYHRVKWGKGNPRSLTKTWKEPLKWDREVQEKGIRCRVFTNSLSDFFDEEVSEDWRFNAMDVIKKTPNLDWLILTKRIQKAHDFLANVIGWPWPNVWVGASIENQEAVDYRLPILGRIPAAVHFISAEPLLEAIDIRAHLIKATHYSPNTGPEGEVWNHPLDWVICGGESGEGFRNMRASWAQNLFDQCQAEKVAFFMKQDSSLYNESKGKIPDGLWNVKEFPKVNL